MIDRALIEAVSHESRDFDRTPRLRRADWLEKALEVLIGNGVEAVRITRLAELLGVTRGSFYWHFKDRSEILEAMIEVWSRKNTQNIVDAANRGPDLEGSMLALFELWLDPGVFDHRLDLAIREWGRGQPHVREIVREADHKRLAALIDMFARDGFAPLQADIRARNLYYMQMGYYALEVREPTSVRLDLVPSYFETYTGRPLRKEAEMIYRRNVIARRHIWGDEPPPEA